MPSPIPPTQLFLAAWSDSRRTTTAHTIERGFETSRTAPTQTLLEGPLPVRIVRAAKFHEFVHQLVGWTIQDGVAYLPEMRTQLVGRPRRRRNSRRRGRGAGDRKRQDHRGASPQEERLADAAAALFASRGDSFEIREGPQPSDPDATAYAEGAALPKRGAKLAGPSFEEWLAAAQV